MSAPPSTNAQDAAQTALDALAEASAWRRGVLEWLMLPTQRVALRALDACGFLVFVVLCSRRWGKTRFAALKVWIVALTIPGAVIRYSAPTKAHGRKFVKPAFAWLTKLAPPHLRPKWSHEDNQWTWTHNGSVCHLGSCETEADVDAQVGTECHFAVVDEAGKIRTHLLRKLIRSIILPQFLTTKGKLCVLGTPPDTPEHYFRELVTDAKTRGTLIKHTIDDCKHVDEAQLAELIKELGGRRTTEARRELDCEFVTEHTRAIVPDFADMRDAVVREVERPKYFDAYMSADMGYRDLSVALFAYYHFDLAAVVVEDELVRQRTGYVPVARAIHTRERLLWGTQTPLARIADCDPQSRSDMYDGTNIDEDGNPCEPIAFGFPKKFNKDAGINGITTRIRDGQFIVHPRCTTLIAHLEFGIWNEHRTDFEPVEGHHWDGIPAASYLLRAVDWGRDPRPRFVASPRRFVDVGVAPKDAHAYQQHQASLVTGTHAGAQTLADYMRSPRRG